MKQVNDLGQAPAADFAVFGPFGNRQLRRLHFMAQFLDHDGVISKKEIPGPADCDTWWSCFKPYRTALLMHDIADTESLDKYAEHIKALDKQWNGKYWFLVAMADFRMRSEHFERMRRRLELQFSELQEAHPGVAKAFTASEPSRPWNEVFKIAPDETAYWDSEVKDKALKFMNAPSLARTPDEHGEFGQPRSHGQGKRKAQHQQPPHQSQSGASKAQKRSSKATDNKTRACHAYNSAAGCSAADCTAPHACSFCGLMGHTLSICRNRLKGKGGGKGGGNGGGEKGGGNKRRH